MNHFFKSKLIILLIAVFVLSVLPFFTNLFDTSRDVSQSNELYNPNLASINSLSKASFFIDSIYSLEGSKLFDTIAYVAIANDFTKYRFYHGVSSYDASENWIAWLSGKLIWSHLSVIVKPNDILKHSKGLCSQQSLVFMELLKQKNISVRSVGLGSKEGPGHFVCEVNYNNTWHTYDVSKEPDWKNITVAHQSMDYYLQHKDSLFKVYQSKLDKTVFAKIVKKVSFGMVNKTPGTHMLWFHNFTFFIIYSIPIITLIMLLSVFYIRHRVPV